MNLHKLIFINNPCYKVGKEIIPKGIMVHSTGANNPWLKRYVNPDDGLLGKNQYNNHWNQAMDRQVCVHAFIGKLADGTIATYQTLPWDMRGWHGASGSKGCCNDTHIGFEICEDGLSDPAYFKQVYQEAVELCVYLCNLYGLTEKNIICHCEGHAQGIASNHGDVMHWFPKHGKNMDKFRADVKVLLDKNEEYSEKTDTLYRVQIGAYSVKANADAQLSRAKAVGFHDAYITIDNRSSGVTAVPNLKSIEEIAREVIQGKWGKDAARKKALTDAGYNYDTVQAKVNSLLS